MPESIPSIENSIVAASSSESWVRLHEKNPLSKERKIYFRTRALVSLGFRFPGTLHWAIQIASPGEAKEKTGYIWELAQRDKHIWAQACQWENELEYGADEEIGTTCLTDYGIASKCPYQVTIPVTKLLNSVS